jgi:RHS repeat-associated protein
MTSRLSPADDSGHPYSYQYDAMARPSLLTGYTPNSYGGFVQTTWGASWGTAGELLSFAGDTRTYNSLGQLTRITAPGLMDIEYRYTAGQNNGRLWQSKDWVTGEEVTYTYDMVNRLIGAATTDASWGQAYTYDGFGNLTGKTVTKGSAPSFSASYDPSTNGGPNPSSMPSGYTDNNDVEGRPLTGSVKWTGGGGPVNVNGRVTYDASGKRVFWSGSVSMPSGTSWVTRTACEIYLYGITGQKLATYSCVYNDNWDAGDHGEFSWGEENRNIYFGGKPVQLNGVKVVTDRLGSVRANGNGETFSYFPYGEERGTSADGREKFGTYFRDSGGQDYADQRYYLSASGRFNVPDPLGLGAANPADPASWNRYAYVQGDPVNFTDRNGTNVDECTPGDDSTYCQYRNGSSGYWGYGFYGYWGSEGYVNVYGPVFYQQPGQRGGGGVVGALPRGRRRGRRHARR